MYSKCEGMKDCKVVTNFIYTFFEIYGLIIHNLFYFIVILIPRKITFDTPPPNITSNLLRNGSTHLPKQEI
jgi:hypothetical protein